MNTDLSEQIRELIGGGAGPVSLHEITERTPAAVPAPRVRRRPWRAGRLAATAIGVIAAGCAGAITASQLGSSPGTAPAARGSAATHGALLTAATVRHLASASRAALASSGRAVISSRDTEDGKLQDYSTDDITFSGRNWNDAFRQGFPASGGQSAGSQFAINRIVNGRAYYYLKGRTDRLEWYRDTNPAGHPSITIPDPRTVLRMLAPSARFDVAGYQLIGGIRLEKLRATSLSRLPSLGALPDVSPGERVTGLEVWVDGHGVVRRMNISVQQSVTVFAIPSGGLPLPELAKLRLEIRKDGRLHHPAEVRMSLAKLHGRMVRGRTEVQVTTLTVSFLDIGKPEVIRPPTHAIPVYSQG